MKLSIILPTYNNANTLTECLKSLTNQNFPKKDYEILIIDGGSTDKTLEIANKFRTTILHNPKRVEDNARIIGIKRAKAEIIAFIDADNIVIGRDWISKMLKPFDDNEIVCADTKYFDYLPSNSMKVRYQALIGGDDPIATYLGFYSRWCYFKNNWTDFPYESEKKKGYDKVTLTNSELIPSIGSNGFLARKKIFSKFFFSTQIHPDYIYQMVKKGYNKIAKVNTGIVHNQPTFFKNKIRRIKRRMNKEIKVEYHYDLTNMKMLLLTLRIITLIPLTVDIIRGYIKKPNSAWLFHYPASIGLLFIYGFYKIKELFGTKIWN